MRRLRTGQRKLERFNRYWRLIRATPPRLLVQVVLDKASKSIRMRTQRLRVTLGLESWSRTGEAKRFGSFRKEVQFFGLNKMGSSSEELLSALSLIFPESMKELLHRAEESLNHRFDLLGSGPVCLGKDIDWHRDFKSGRRWDPVYFEDIREVELENSSDIKVPWELSRCYHFVTLGKAFFRTRNERYAAEFVSQLEHWIRSNKAYFGVNWHCSMEVAFRAVNWIWAYYLFNSSERFSIEKQAMLVQSLLQHGRYIYNNLEFDKRVLEGKYVRVNGNHYLSDLVGLVYLGVVLPGKEPRKWLKKAVEEIITEIDIQILPDGVHWELAPSYHRLVAEMLLSTLILCRDNGIDIPKATLERVELMCVYMLHYIKPNGLCPLVRDADDGRLHLLGNNEFRDHRHLLPVAGLFFENSELLSHFPHYSEDALWLMGVKGHRKYAVIEKNNMPLKSAAFCQAQYFVMRGADGTHVFISCANVGMNGHYGGHAHSDCLSFELFFGNETFITDSGSYVYSAEPEWRNRFRSTEFHNTLRVDKTDINTFSPTVLFGMENNAKPKIIEWISEDGFDYLVAEHFGYTRLANGVIHRREFYFDKISDVLLVTDSVLGNGEHLLEFFLHFNPDVACQRMNGLLVLSKADKQVYVNVRGLDGWDVRIEEAWVSERYGKKRPSKRCVISKHCSVPTELTVAFICSGSSITEAVTTACIENIYTDAMAQRHTVAEHGTDARCAPAQCHKA